MATVKQGQSFLDMVIQETGNIANAFEMAILNSVGITDDLEVGTEIKPAGKMNKTFQVVFDEKNKPATAAMYDELDDDITETTFVFEDGAAWQFEDENIFEFEN